MHTLSQLIAEARAYDEERLNLDRRSKALKKQVDDLSSQIIEGMRLAGLTLVDGARLEEIQKPFISDFSQLESYIIEHGAIDLLQKRLTESAVKLRWEDGIQIPGVGVSTEQKLRL